MKITEITNEDGEVKVRHFFLSPDEEMFYRTGFDDAIRMYDEVRKMVEEFDIGELARRYPVC